MSEILLLYHAQGHTPGVAALADRIAGAGHAVHAWRTLRVTSRA